MASADPRNTDVDFSADVNVENMAQQQQQQQQQEKESDQTNTDDGMKKKKATNKRGGVKRRLSALAYQQQQYMLMRGGHPGGRPLHVSGANATQPVMPMRYPGVPPPRPFPPQKFGFFNEAAPSVHPGHPGSEKRTYEGPPKPRLMMEDLRRIPGPRTMGGPRPPMFAPPPVAPPGRVELNGGPSNEPPPDVGNRSAVTNEQQAGMNELFAKMVWKKLDMIQSPTRLNRLHTEIMNLLQQAIAEETGK